MEEDQDVQTEQEDIKDDAQDDVRLFDQEDSESEAEPEAESETGPNLTKVAKEVEGIRREQKVSDFLNNPKNLDYKDFSEEIRKLALKPEAKGLTINAIANMVVPKDYWLKKGAEMAKQAEQESSQSYSGGGSARSVSGGADQSGLPNPSEMSSEEFMREAWKIARGE